MIDPTFLAAHDFAIIDQVAVDGLPNDLPLLSIAPHGLKSDAHLLPLLLPLKTLSRQQQSMLLEQHAAADESVHAPWLSTLLATEISPEHLQSHLSSRLIVRLGAKDKALLRYYDPRVFKQLQWIFNPAQMPALYGPIKSWSIFLDGQWESMPVPAQATAHPSRAFDQPTRARLERIGLINQAIASLNQPHQVDRINLGQAIDRFLIRALDIYNIERDEDRVAFALQALIVHPDFDRHRAIQSLIHRSALEQTSYRDATALLDQAAWQRIATDMTNKGTTCQ